MRTYLPQLIKFAVFAVVTVLLTMVLAATIANRDVGEKTEYSARFTDATGLNPNDEIRMAGVRIGTVKSIEVVDRKFAEVRFSINSRRKLPTSTTASIKYRNLVGRRYVSLNVGDGNPAEVLRPGTTIPLERTTPALNLTVLFNGFKPLFQALKPEQVNQLSYEIIQVLQGESGTIDSLLRNTASLTSTIAKKDKVIGRVVNNLNSVLGTVNQRSPELTNLIDQMQQLVTGLSQQRTKLGSATHSLANLTETTSGLLSDARPPLRKNIAELGAVAKNLNEQEPLLDKLLGGMADRLGATTRTASYAGWFNYYACRMHGDISIDSLRVEVPIFPLPAQQLPDRCTQ